MKRVLIAVITALALAVGVAAAQANTPSDGFPGTGGTPTQQAAVAGTVVSVNALAGTFVANASVVLPPSTGSGDSTEGSAGSGTGFGGFGGSGGFGGFGSGGFGGFGGDLRTTTTTTPTTTTPTTTTPTTTQVTITTNSSTIIRVFRGTAMGTDVVAGTGNGSVSDLVPGAKFLALFPGASTDTIQTLVAKPATSIYAEVPKQFYAFVGTVTATSTTANTLTVDVTRSLPSSLIAGGTSATFTVDPKTFIIGGSSLSSGGPGGLFGGLFGGSLSGVSKGDLVAGGLIANGGLTATQVEATPLMFLLDLPAPSTTTTTTTTTTASSTALKVALKLLHGEKVKVNKHGKKSHGKKSRHAGRR